MEVLSFDGPSQWEAWLTANHEHTDSAWVKIGKKGAKQPSLGIADAADVALCFGWIDSIRKALDDDHYLQRYSRRRPKGSWSRVNVDRVEALTAAGRMRPSGLAEVAAAKADGRWDAAYAGQRTATVPPDLTAALAADPPARDAFEQLGKTEQYLAMLPVLKARTPEIRAARLRKLLGDLTGQGPAGP